MQRVARLLFMALLLGAVPRAAAVPPDARGLPTLAPLVQQVTPAVVNISVVTRSPMEDNPLFRDPFFRRFFNVPDRPQQRASRPRAPASSSTLRAATCSPTITSSRTPSR